MVNPRVRGAIGHLAAAGIVILSVAMGPARFAWADCGAHAMPLHALATARRGHSIKVSGVVTGVFPRMRGFFIEAPRAQWDDSADTSEAVFVYGGRTLPGSVAPGQRLAFTARYQSYHGLPELAYPRGVERCGRHALPPAITVSLPQDTQQWQALLGMRIRIGQALTVDDLDDFVRYGEVRLHAGGRHYAPTALTAPGPAVRELHQASARREIWLDDGNSAADPQQLRLGNASFDALHPLRIGDVFESVAGIAYHAYGRDLVEATQVGRGHTVNARPARATQGLPPGLRVVTFNVENYFNRAVSGPVFPTERGARTRAQWRCQTDKLVASLQAMQPAVAGLEEIENNGHGPNGALATLVGALNHSVAGAPYRFIRTRTRRLGTDLIAPALVYDTRRVTPVGRVAVLVPPSDDRAVRAGLTRPALAASFRARKGGEAFTVVVVHLRSKRSSCGASLDGRSGGGDCARARALAIPYLEHWIGKRPTGIVSAAVVLMGDFNAYPREAAIRELSQAGWQMEPPLDTRDPQYTENGSWGSGRLDYVFLTPHLAKGARGAAIWHIDADEARGFGYAGRPVCRGRAAPYRASDHDPVIVVLPRS